MDEENREVTIRKLEKLATKVETMRLELIPTRVKP